MRTLGALGVTNPLGQLIGSDALGELRIAGLESPLRSAEAAALGSGMIGRSGGR